jgi:hypothetical protein
MTETSNPYLPPAAIDDDFLKGMQAADSADGSGWRSRGWRVLTWNLVAGFNMIVCWMFGWAAVGEGIGRVAMGMGVLAILGAGSLAAMRGSKVIRVVQAGALPLILTQFFPVLQMLSGMMAIGLVEAVGMDEMGAGPGRQGRDFSLTSPLGAFAATLLTAAPMILISGGLGMLLRFAGSLLGLTKNEEFGADKRLWVPEPLIPAEDAEDSANRRSSH